MENKNNKFKAFICSGWGKATIILLSYIVIFCAICCILGSITYIGEIGIFALLVFMAILAIFGWRALRKITPRIFLIMPIIGWIIFFLIKAILSFIIGVFVAPYVIARGIANIVQKSMNNQVEHNKSTDLPTNTIHNETELTTDQSASLKQTDANTDSTMANTTNTEQSANLQGMKWHNFLVNFGLHAQTVFFLIFGIGLIILSFLDNSALCNFLDSSSISLEPILSTMIYIVYGVFIAIAGLLSFWTRKYLLEYKIGGITLLEGNIYLYTVTISVFIPLIIFYSDSLSSLNHMIDEDIRMICFAFSCLLLLIGGFIYQMINKAYYKRRKHLFTK